VSTHYRIVPIGDSVVWGQGLEPREKFTSLVARDLEAAYPGNVVLESADVHSGAVIGTSITQVALKFGEVPESFPSIIDQCSRFTNSPETVNLVLLNGGINDVGVNHIMNPLAIYPTLSARVEEACYRSMKSLLTMVSQKFSLPNCQILVLGYYPILSNQSDPTKALKFLQAHGIHKPDYLTEDLDFFDPIVQRCLSFWNDSTTYLRKAVSESHDPRIAFLDSGFTEANSVFSTVLPYLFGVELDGTFGPEDPMALTRHLQCDAVYPANQELNRQFCYRASAGHPNVLGAAQYARQIKGVLRL
jgi:lysophospholipase L1-like esterase